MNIHKPKLITDLKTWWILIFISLHLISISSCKKQYKKEAYTIAFSQCIGSDAWRETMYIEMQRELSFHNDVNFIYYDAKGNNDTQIKQVKEILKRDIDLLIISPNEAEPLTPIVDEVFQKGIPVIVTDRKTSSGLYNAYVGANNYDIGHLAGVYLSQKLNGKGTIAEVTGLPGASASIERQQGFRTALKEYPEIKIIKSLNGQWLIKVAKQVVSNNPGEILKADAIFAFNDQMALGTYQALQTIAPIHPIKIVGVDALAGKNNGLEQIANGVFDASMLYPTGGKEAIRTALAILKKQPYKRETILRTMVIDSTNVQLMKMQADKVDNQQQDIDKQQALLAEQKAIYRDQQTVLNILVISLVLAIVFGGISFYLLKANWEKNKRLEKQNKAILDQQKELISLNKQLKEATDAKINFFTNISHEFKTPLTLILSPVEDLISDKNVNPAIKDQLQLVRKNSLRLMKLVTQLIDLRRVGYEKMKLQAYPQNMVSFINQIVQSFKPLSSHKHIAINIENQSKNEPIWFDSNLMEKIIYNLLSNALKFTNDYGKIQIKLENNKTDDYLCISIEDNGRGIKEPYLNHIFDPFYQGEYSAEGSGIGLALVKDIVELHHGNISVHSQENKGTCFTVKLPIGNKHLDEQEKATRAVEQPIDSLIDLDKYMIDLEQTAFVDNFDDNNLPLKEHSVLIIDDNVDILHFLKQKLANTYTVYSTTNVDDALTIIHDRMPDIILSDLVMPEKSGIDLLTAIKNDSRSSHIPLVLLTAHQNIAKKTEGIEALADMYITKPFNIIHLKAVIQNLITNRKNLQIKYSSQPSEFLHTQPPELSSADKRFLNELSAIVEMNLANSSFGVEDICKPLGISRIQLYRKVKALLKCSVNDYIVARRLTKAKFLLQQDKIINEVADETGFASSTYFATAFKKKYGISPSAFKAKFHRL